MAKATKDASLAEELPYWDFFDEPRAHAVLQDGSLVAGLRVGLIDVECFDENDMNQLTVGLRNALNSVSEGTSLQFLMSVNSNFSKLIDRHERGKTKDIHPLVEKIAAAREKQLREDMNAGVLYRPELFVFARTPPVATKRPGIFKKREMFSAKARDAYQETLETLGQNLDTLTSSLEGVGLATEELSKEQILRSIYELDCGRFNGAAST